MVTENLVGWFAAGHRERIDSGRDSHDEDIASPPLGTHVVTARHDDSTEFGEVADCNPLLRTEWIVAYGARRSY